MLAVPDGYLPLRIDKLLGRSPRSGTDAGLLTHALAWQDAPRSDMKRFALLRVVFAVADRFPQEARARDMPNTVCAVNVIRDALQQCFAAMHCSDVLRHVLQRCFAAMGASFRELHIGLHCCATLGV